MKKILTALTAMMLLAATFTGPAGAYEGGDNSAPSTTVGDGGGSTTTTVADGHDQGDMPDSGDRADEPTDHESPTTTIVDDSGNGGDLPSGDSVDDDSSDRERADRPGRAEERRRRREEKLRREQERRDRKADDNSDGISDDNSDNSDDSADHSTDGSSDTADDSSRRDGERSRARRAGVKDRLLRACREDSAGGTTDVASSEACRIIRDALDRADNGTGEDQGDLTREEVKNRIVEACREATGENPGDDGNTSESNDTAAVASTDQVIDNSGPGADFGRCVRTLRRADARERVVEACRSAVGADSAGLNLDLAERCRRVAEHRPDLTELPDGTKEVCQTALLGGSSRAEELCLRRIAEDLDPEDTP